MQRSLAEMIDAYKPATPLAQASSIPASWYVDPRMLDLERRTVFARSWQCVGRADQVRRAGDYLSCELPGGEPVLVIRGADERLRAFFNVCRHHAAAVVTDAQGSAHTLRCPYHGWTYALDGALKGTPDFAGVCDFDRAANGLVPIEVDAWEQWVFVRAREAELPLPAFLGATLTDQVQRLGLGGVQWVERRRYRLDCNWKVFIDNYLDGGYHVPHLHKGLDSVLDYSEYTIEHGERFCLQWSPMNADGAEPGTAAVRTGDTARYYWIYPNFMINCYAGTMDTNLVVPCGVDQTEVIFDFYFSDVSEAAGPRNRASIDISERIQEEDTSICSSVQRGLRSGAYTSGRLSVRREAGEHLFHRLLHADLTAGVRV
jgi:phenylpropionate dioxygenase-like ring-hydroxylating dioxygenase large terminal subunit